MNKVKSAYLSFFLRVLLLNFAAGAAVANVHYVTVSGKSLNPSSVTVNSGDTVIWINNTGNLLELTCNNGSSGTSHPEAAQPFAFQVSPESNALYRVTASGNYLYKSVTSVSVHYGEIVAVSPLPVQLTDFVATTIKNEVILDWSTIGEVNNEKFEIQRRRTNEKSEGNFGVSFVTIGTINGIGNTSAVHNYRFVDKNLESGSYSYRLKQLDYNGNYVYHLLSTEVNIGTPSRFRVSGNYPNPFNPQTSFNVDLPGHGDLAVLLFDAAGKRVMNAFDGSVEAGYRKIEINGSTLNSGVYFCRFEFNSNGGIEMLTRRILLLK